jgi:4-amino-4-deoxy-L-arabinose transferase-like glycosyltransferase
MTTPTDTAPAAVSTRRKIPFLNLALYALIAFGCALRIFNVIDLNIPALGLKTTLSPLDHLWSDPLRHWAHAREPLTPSPMALFDPPVYQIWLSVLQKITMGLPELVEAFVAALSIIGPWCWYRFLRETITSRTLALTGLALLALLPSWIGIYSYFMTETLFLPALGASLWLSMRARRKKTLPSFMGMVGMWIFCGLTRPVAIPAAALFATVVWFGHPQKLRTAMWSIALIAVTLAPFSWRNYYYYGIWAPHGNGWINKIYATSGARIIELHFEKQGARWVYGFGSPSIDSRPFEPFSDWTSKRSGTVMVNIDFMNKEKDWEKAYEASTLHGAALWQLRVENWAYLFFGNSWPDNNPEYFMGRLANLSRWIWAPLALVLLIATIIWWRTALSRPLIPLTIAIWLFFQGWMLVVPNEGRYRKPLEGLLVVYALILLDAKRSSRSVVESKVTPDNPEPVSPAA